MDDTVKEPRMKRLLFLLALAVGCHAQVPPAVTYSCPATTGTAYTALSTTTSALTLVDTKPGAASWCYIVQAKDSNGGVSVPSNTAMVTPTATQSVTLTWNASTSCTGCTYIVSRVAATASQPTAPTLTTPTVAMNQTAAQTVAKLELHAVPSGQ